AVTEQRKASAAMLEKAMVAASVDIETLRSQLIDGQPCPVCGSESHPYAHENPQLNHVLDELRKAHEAIEHAYSDHVSSHGQLSQAVPLLRQTLEQLDGELAAKQRELNEHIRQWEQYPISEACADIEPAHKETWLSDRAQKLTADQKKVSERLDQHQHLQDTLNHRHKILHELLDEYTDSADAVKD